MKQQNSMKKFYRIVFPVIFLPLFLHSQHDAEEEALYKTELRRYQMRTAHLSKISSTKEDLDVKYYKLNVRIADQKGYLSGEVTTLAVVRDAAITNAVFDLSSPLSVDLAFVDGVKASSVSSSTTVSITLPRTYTQGETLTIQLIYSGYPPYTGLGSYTDGTASDNTRWVYTLSEPYGARDWWPCIDHPTDKADSIDIWITCSENLLAVTNGKLVETVQNNDATKTYKWKHRYPIASYLVSVTIGNFSSFSDWYKYSAADSMEIVNYVLSTIGSTSPSYRSNAALTVKMMEIFSAMFGQYPFIKEKYGHAQFGWSGGMEHQTLTSLGSYSFSEATMAHELVHQWFGDMITCRTWRDLWLNEGFAQYFECVWREKMYGISAYRTRIAQRLTNAKNAVGTVYVQDTANVNNLFAGSRVYDKGASVLHMLRHVLGDSLFFAAIYAYAHDSTLMYGTAATPHFQYWCEQVSGKDLDWFFTEWIYGEKYPKYTYTHVVDSSANGFTSKVRITQTTGTNNPAFFTMPIDLKFSASGWDTTVTVFNNAADQTFEIPLSRRATAAAFDPDVWILRDVTFNPAGVLAGQLPQKFVLKQNYPNPFNPKTTISFTLQGSGFATLKVFDLLGREIGELVNEEKDAGEYSVQWDASHVPSGVYMYRLQFGSSTQSRKMMLVK
jgi:aminopeptidase N